MASLSDDGLEDLIHRLVRRGYPELICGPTPESWSTSLPRNASTRRSRGCRALTRLRLSCRPQRLDREIPGQTLVTSSCNLLYVTPGRIVRLPTKESKIMARKTIRVSDISGEEIPEGGGATVRITFADARRGARELDVTDAEADKLGGRQVARRGRKPKSVG